MHIQEHLLSHLLLSSAIELVRALNDDDFVHKLIACDYVEQVYDRFRVVKAGDGDPVRASFKEVNRRLT